MKAAKGYVYMLTNRKGNVLYVGSTENLKERLKQHRQRLLPGFTRQYNVDKLVYYEELADMGVALCREKQIKGKCRAKKNALIEKSNPNYLDLSLTLIDDI